MAAGAAVAQSTSPVGEGPSPTFKHRRRGEVKGGCEIGSSQALSSDTARNQALGWIRSTSTIGSQKGSFP